MCVFIRLMGSLSMCTCKSLKCRRFLSSLWSLNHHNHDAMQRPFSFMSHQSVCYLLIPALIDRPPCSRAHWRLCELWKWTDLLSYDVQACSRACRKLDFIQDTERSAPPGRWCSSWFDSSSDLVLSLRSVKAEQLTRLLCRSFSPGRRRNGWLASACTAIPVHSNWGGSCGNRKCSAFTAVK